MLLRAAIREQTGKLCGAVYALNELVQACNKHPEEAKPIADGLLRKVASSNPVTKYKVREPLRLAASLQPHAR